MNRISYSQLSMYSQCPLHWKLRYVDEILPYPKEIDEKDISHNE